MNKDLIERIAEEWAQLDPVDPLRRLLSDVIDVLAQPAQEPVAWIREHELPLAPGDAFSWVETFVHKTPLYTISPAEIVQKFVTVHQYRVPHCSDWYDGLPDHHDGHGPYEVRTLYTTPQQRPWVGLTDEEASWCQAPSTVQTWKRIEAKLKEKNT